MIPGAAFNKKTDNILDDFPKLLKHNPCATSIQSILHFAQLINIPENLQKFTKYNYGTEKNLQLYGSAEPPEYDLRNIQTKVILIKGTKDDLSNHKDVNA